MSIVRQKRAFVIIATVTVLLYVNWFINVKKFERTIFQERSNTILKVFVADNSNEQAAENLISGNEGSLVRHLLSDQNEPTTFNRPESSLEKLSLEDLSELFNILYSNKVCLLHIEILNEITRLANETDDFRYNILKVFKLNTYFSNSNDQDISRKPYVTFGVGYLTVEKLQEVNTNFND